MSEVRGTRVSDWSFGRLNLASAVSYTWSQELVRWEPQAGLKNALSVPPWSKAGTVSRHSYMVSKWSDGDSRREALKRERRRGISVVDTPQGHAYNSAVIGNYLIFLKINESIWGKGLAPWRKQSSYSRRYS